MPFILSTSWILLPLSLFSRITPIPTLTKKERVKDGELPGVVFSGLQSPPVGQDRREALGSIRDTLLTLEPPEAGTQCVTEDLTWKDPWIVISLAEPAFLAA